MIHGENKKEFNIIIGLNIFIYGLIDSLLTWILLNGPYKEFNPIANYNFYLFLIVKCFVLIVIYLLMIQTKRNLAGYVLLFFGLIASMVNIGVIYF